MKSTNYWIAIICIVLTWGCSKDTDVSGSSESYYVETIALPPGLEGETGAIGFLPDGRLVACFLRGEVMIYDPESGKWDCAAELRAMPDAKLKAVVLGVLF